MDRRKYVKISEKLGGIGTWHLRLNYSNPGCHSSRVRIQQTGSALSETKIQLKESDMPTHWYNVMADMPNPPAPPLGLDGNPVGPDALAAIFPEALIMQDEPERWIPIPKRCRIFCLWRPSPLFRAHRLSRH